MLRDLIDRFSYRYRVWVGETQGDKVGAGVIPPRISMKDEPAWRLIFRFLQMLAGGLIVLALAGSIAAHALPAFSKGTRLIVIFLAIIWCAVGLFVLAGELLTKYTESRDDDKASNQSLQSTASRSDE